MWKGVVNIPQNRKRESNNDNMHTDIAFFVFISTNIYIYLHSYTQRVNLLRNEYFISINDDYYYQ